MLDASVSDRPKRQVIHTCDVCLAEFDDWHDSARGISSALVLSMPLWGLIIAIWIGLA